MLIAQHSELKVLQNHKGLSDVQRTFYDIVCHIYVIKSTLILGLESTLLQTGRLQTCKPALMSTS